MEKPGKNYTPQEKVSILRRYLIDKEPGSKRGEELGLHPAVFCRWLKGFSDQGAAAFERKDRPSGREEAQQQRIEALAAKLKKKDEVLAELMEERVALRKVLGRSEGRMGAARYARLGERLRPPLERAHPDRGQEVHRLTGNGHEQVLRRAGALGSRERAQRLGAAGILAGCDLPPSDQSRL